MRSRKTLQRYFVPSSRKQVKIISSSFLPSYHYNNNRNNKRFVHSKPSKQYQNLFKNIEETNNQLLLHPIYNSINNQERLRVFMRHHVFAVWDFMVLLKRLQKELTCTDVIWLPSEKPQLTRFINEIVLAEECDEDGNGAYNSHYMLYRLAMDECEADATEIDSFINLVKKGQQPESALLKVDNIPSSIRNFVHDNIVLAKTGKIHEVAAVFCLGRENVIPEMFQRLLPKISQIQTTNHIKHYIVRHIEVDGDSHGPLATELLQYLAGDNPDSWKEAENASQKALSARIRLWDGVMHEIHSKNL